MDKKKNACAAFLGMLERTRIEATFIFGDIRNCCQVFCKDNWGLVFCIQKNNKITLTTCPVLTFIYLSKETVFYKQTCNKKAGRPACPFLCGSAIKVFCFFKVLADLFRRCGRNEGNHHDKHAGDQKRRQQFVNAKYPAHGL